MALINCPECSREISDKAEACPYCGFPGINKLSKKTLSKAVVCSFCSKELELEDELCPHCGHINSQKYSHSKENEPETVLDKGHKEVTSKDYEQISKSANELLIASIIFGLIGAFIGFILNSSIVGVLSSALGFCLPSRANYLAKYPHKRLKFERHLFGWKGIVGYIVLVIIIVNMQSAYDKHKNKIEQEKAKETQQTNDKTHLGKAQELLSKSRDLNDNEWISIKNNLTAVTSGAEYQEAKKLLPSVSKKVDEIEAKQKEIARQEELKKEKALKDKEEAGLNPKGKRVRARHPEWSIEDCDTISRGKIRIGFTREQVAASWGRPYHINRTHNVYGTSEQWVMSDGLPSSYVYFDDGICTSIQN